jgi:bifunctional enzyme CysN/CysC
VDHGKSTLIGRILFDTGSLPDGKVEQIQAACKAEGMPFEYAFLLDALLEEQEQNITIDTTQIQFKTPLRPYVIIDAPGHKEFLKNMITGAASADAALLLIAANEGVQEQSRRHGYLLSLLGLKQVVVVVNKMDLVDWSQDRFNEIVTEYTAFLTQLGVTPQAFIPIAAKHGANIAQSAPELTWYQGQTVVQALDSFHMPIEAENQPLRFSIQDVYRFDHRRILAGRLISGSLKVGDTLHFTPGGKSSVIKSFEVWNKPEQHSATVGESIAFTLTEQIFVARGHLASHPDDVSTESTQLRANLFWLGKTPLEIGPYYKLKLINQEVEARIKKIIKIIDASTLAEVALADKPIINKNDVAEIVLETRQPLAFDLFSHSPETGRFVVVQNNQVAGGGIILSAPLKAQPGPKSQNIVWSENEINQEHRFARNGHKGAVIWMTGLSGSGKSTLSSALEKELFYKGMQTYVLDGDNIRYGLNRDLGFSKEDRVENIRRVGEVAKLMAEAGLIVVTAFISPFQNDRDRAREICAEAQIPFFEIFINASLAECEKRDPKNLYKKARAGEIKEFTGLSSPYEAPQKPELEVRTDQQTFDESLAQLTEYVLEQVEWKDTGFEI